MSPTAMVDCLAPRASAIVEFEAVIHGRHVANIDLRVERDNIALRFELERSPTLLYLGIAASRATVDLPAFDTELRRIIRVIFDARPDGLDH